MGSACGLYPEDVTNSPICLPYLTQAALVSLAEVTSGSCGVYSSVFCAQFSKRCGVWHLSSNVFFHL